MISTESNLEKICDNCAYFHKINEYSTHGYCYWLLKNKDKQVNANYCCYCWVGKDNEYAFKTYELYIRKSIRREYEEQFIKNK